jgi:hypothetical protein
LGENVSNPEEYDVVVLGSRVTVVDRNDALAHREDRDVSEALRGLFDDDRTSVNDNLPPKGYRTTVNTRQNGGIVSATSMLRDGHSERPEIGYQFGLLRHDYTPKPAFETYRRLITDLGAEAWST